MNIPIIDGLLAGNSQGTSNFTTPDKGNARLRKLLAESIKGLEASLAAGEIYNTEYKDAYSYISRAAEEAMDQSTAPFRGDQTSRSWEQNDPRWYTVYHPSFANVGGALKKLMKFKGKNDEPRVNALIPVLEETMQLLELTKKLKPLIKKGRKPNPNYVAPDLTNTGTCCICQHRQKLAKGQMLVDHGFKISDGLHYFGSRVGHCFGVNYQPFEISCEANKKFVIYLQAELKRTREHLAELKSGTIEKLFIIVREREGFGYKDVPKTLLKGEAGFDRELQSRVIDAETQERYLLSDIKNQQKLIREWKSNPAGLL